MRKKLISILTIALILICLLQFSSFAIIDQAKLFISEELAYNTYNIQVMTYAVKTFKILGYNILNGNTGALNYHIANSRNQVLDYISGTGNNYGFFVHAHASDGAFNMSRDGDNAPQRIYSSDITGYWHFVFINGCSSMASDSLARGFKTVGYSNRASLGWYKGINNDAGAEWWKYFKDEAGKTNLRDACLNAADQCKLSTPIRMYGDKTWNGKAWDK